MSPAMRRWPWLLSGAGLLVLGLWFLHLAAFHAWLAGGPPSPHPEWHRRWATRFFALACAGLAGSAWTLWRARRNGRDRSAAGREPAA